MRLLLLGGSGLVGSLLVEPWAGQHDVRVLDPRPPAQASSVGYFSGKASNLPVLTDALQGVDALVYLAMGPDVDLEKIETALAHFEVSVRDVYAALRVAHEAGVNRVVYASSLSVFADEPSVRMADELPPNATRFYGLSKRLGEQVCEAAGREWGMSVVALRLVLPRPNDEWLAMGNGDDWAATAATQGDDVVAAFDAALARTEVMGSGFEAYLVSGDSAHRYHDMAKAERVLGWKPRATRSPVS